MPANKRALSALLLVGKSSTCWDNRAVIIPDLNIAEKGHPSIIQQIFMKVLHEPGSLKD